MIKNTWHIHIQGQVQGVGFRPFIYRLAQKHELNGWVNNAGDGVHIEFNADEKDATNFYKELRSSAPELSHITSHCIKEIAHADYKSFQIITSSITEKPLLLISPDFGMCSDCRTEISDKTNRRYNYAFTTCTLCGPRYSIIQQLPYDREQTSMDVFKMCSKCQQEYNDPKNRRYFSQTNSCADCAVKIELVNKTLNLIEEDQNKIIKIVCDLWSDGEIIAIKGIGGYLLTCDASNENTIKELRKRKNRPAKPFALMFPDINHLLAEVKIDLEEKEELESAAAPIVLLQIKANAGTQLVLEELAPKLSRLGVMLPYAPLYQLLLSHFKKPIVATSGNISNAPIIYKDDVARNELTTIADYILLHDREIILPQDDSVVQYSRYNKKRITIRRARGFAPFYLNKKLSLPDETILAAGALIKSSFSILHSQNIHVSQYLGDTSNYDTQQIFENNVDHYLQLFHAQPGVIIADKHPGYFTTQLAQKLSDKWNVPLIKVQHHEAHFASVLGEHNLINENEPVLGVIWDGTGLGDDGQIWGGEFFIYQHKKFLRSNHFDYFPHLLGDKMACEPRLSAFSICAEMEGAAQILEPKFTPVEWNNYKQLISKNELKTSSVGRLFDAVASLLGIIDKATFEGEAAVLLEEIAFQYFENKLDIPASWLDESSTENILSTPYLISQIIKKIKEQKDIAEIAAGFHVQLVLSIKKAAIKNNCNKICCSGGVFQNGLLIDLAIKILGDRFRLYFDESLSPNDENISFGQLIWFIISKKA